MRAILATFALIFMVVLGGPAKAQDEPFGTFAVEKLSITPAVCTEVGELTSQAVGRMQTGSSDLDLIGDLSAMARRDINNDVRYLAAMMTSSAIPHIRTRINAPDVMALVKKIPGNSRVAAVGLDMKIKCSKLEGTTYDVPKRIKVKG